MDFMASKANLPTPSKKETGKTKKKTSYRLELDLLKFDVTSFPEYSYASLVKDIKKKNGLETLNNGQDAGEKNDAEAMARHFEAKYGNTSKGKPRKRHRHRATELVDMGYGYDDTDPFVDNSECYDEVVPSSLTTQFGGFYINSGKLEFKQISSDSALDEDEDAEDSLPLSAHIKKRKVLLTSDEERSGHGAMMKHKKIKKRKGSSELDEKRRRKLSLQGKDKLGKITTSAKKKHTKVQLLVAKAKAQQQHLNNSGSSSDKSMKSKERSLSNGDKNKTLSETGKDLLNFLAQSTPGNMSIQNIMDESYKNGDLLKSSDEDLPTSKLSETIPNNIRSQISSLSKIAKSSEKEGKVKFFSPDVNNLLYNIESGSQSLSNKDRLDIYQHLTTHVPCSKDTLVKRMKKLVTTKQDERVRQPLLLLKEAIDRVMGQQMKDYDEECVASQLAKLDDRNVLAVSTDEDDENTATVNGEEKTKRYYAPRRKFKWPDHIRNLFFDVVRIKVEHFETLKNKHSQSAEDYLKAYFENEVKPLWPKGWMQSRMLYKESREIHSAITGNQLKQKKVVVSGPKKATATTKVEKKNFSLIDSVAKKSVGSLPDTNKTTNQLFKEHQAGLSVNLSLGGNEIIENKTGDILHRAIASAHRDLAQKQPSSQMVASKLTPKQQPSPQMVASKLTPKQQQPNPQMAPSKMNPKQQQPSPQMVQSKMNPKQHAAQMVASKLPNKEQTTANTKLTQDLLKSMGLSVEYLKSQERGKSSSSKIRNETIGSKKPDSPSSVFVKQQTPKQHRLPPNELIPHSFKSNHKSSTSHSTAKSQPSKNASPNALTKACYDQYNAELLKLARMIPGSSQSIEKSLANVFNYQVPAIPGNLDDLNKFMQLQQAAMATSPSQRYMPGISKPSKSTAANEAFRFSIKGSSPKMTAAPNQNQIKSPQLPSQKARHLSAPKIGNNASNRSNEPYNHTAVSLASSSAVHFIPPASPTLNHSASKLAHSAEKKSPHQNLQARKSNASPVSPSTIFHPQKSSSNLHPNTTNYSSKSSFSPYPGNYVYSMRANIPASLPTPVTPTSNTPGMSYGSYEQLLKVTPPSDRKFIPQCSIDQRDKAAMDALLSARSQGTRR